MEIQRHEMDLIAKAELLAEVGDIRFIDFHFMRFLKQLDSDINDDVLLAGMLVSNYLGKGDVCIDLMQLSEQRLFSNSLTNINICTPDSSKWLQSLKNSKLISVDGSVAPLVLVNDNYLFFSRYWDYELSLAEYVVKKAIAKPQVDIQLLRSGIKIYFPEISVKNNSVEPDWQMISAVSALLNNFTVITGGPGTGKTTTVTKILALFVEQYLSNKKKIVLAAPTGKAANRLSDSIKKAKVQLNLKPEIAEKIPDQVITIHRLLGISPAKATCYYNAENKLHLDLLVVDEASMIDLAMMAKLMQALPESSQLILLGDMNQLASVESGCVLADICSTGLKSRHSQQRLNLLTDEFDLEVKDSDSNVVHPLGDCVISLKKSYRFDSDSGIGKLANATNEGNSQEFFSAFDDSRFVDISWNKVDSLSIQKYIDTIDVEPYRNYLQAENAEQALDRLAAFQILSPVRDGLFGINNLNILIKNRLQRLGLIRGGDTSFHGQPIMITENNYKIGLYNGDVGIIWNEAGELKAYFPIAEGGVKRFVIAKLPKFETVFAMTVHKSQGSEFDNVLIVFPDKYAEHLTKELLYTAITRAKTKAEIWGVEEVIAKTIKTKVNRNSLLQNQIEKV